MISPMKVSKELLNKFLYKWSTQEELNALLQEHPELEPYHQVVDPMLSAVSMVMSIIGQQVLDGDVRAKEDVLDPNISRYAIYFMLGGDNERVARHPKIPDEIIRDIIMKTEYPSDALEVFLTIHAGLEFPDYLTEESYWLLRALDFGISSKFQGECEYSLRFCLEEGINKEFILNLLETYGEKS